MGLIKIRLIAGVNLFCSVISLVQTLVQVVLFGTPVNPAQFAPAILLIALALFLLKGSKAARIALAVLSIISAGFLLLAAVLLALTPPGAEVFSTLIFVSFGVIFAGIAYLLLFSNDLKEEVLRRAKIKQSRERLDRQKYYESLGTQYEE
jgi:hypothetical protein